MGHLKPKYFKKAKIRRNYHDTHDEIHNLTNQELDLVDEIVHRRSKGETVLHPAIYPTVPPKMLEQLKVEDAKELVGHTHSRLALSRKHKELLDKGGGAKIDAVIKVGKTVGAAIAKAAKAVGKSAAKAAEFVAKYHKEIFEFVNAGLSTAQAIQSLAAGTPAPEVPVATTQVDNKKSQAAAKMLEDSDEGEGLGGSSKIAGSSSLPGGSIAPKRGRSKVVVKRSTTRRMI